MMNFEYKREVTKLKAYGQEYEIPTKTAIFAEEVNKITKRLQEAKNAAESMTAAWDGIALYIGKDETQRIFPRENLENLDTDEISAFWLALNAASNRNTNAVINKYAPNAAIKKPVK